MNTKDFLTIKEASDLTGKSEITIRRLIKLVRSQPEKVISQMTTQNEYLPTQLHSQMIRQDKESDKAKSPFVYRIKLELLAQMFDLPTQMSSQVTKQKDNVHSQMSSQKEGLHSQKEESVFDKVLGFLEEQLNVKDKQIERKDKQINDLIERGRESNILIGRLQEQLVLIESPPDTETDEERHEEDLNDLVDKTINNAETMIVTDPPVDTEKKEEGEEEKKEYTNTPPWWDGIEKEKKSD